MFFHDGAQLLDVSVAIEFSKEIWKVALVSKQLTASVTVSITFVFPQKFVFGYLFHKVPFIASFDLFY